MLSADVAFSGTHLSWAVALGLLSAVSLPLGSALGLSWRPRAKITGMLTAFGGGALVAALAIELVAPTATALTDADEIHRAEAAANLVALLLGAVAGGLLFVALDQLVNEHGGFLRKTATTVAFLAQRRAQRQASILKRLSHVRLLREVPPEEVARLVDAVRPVTFSDGESLCREGDAGDRLFFIEEGTVALVRGGAPLKDLDAGETVGEIALLTGAPRTADGRARGAVKALCLFKSDFDAIRAESPELQAAASELASRRLDELATRTETQAREATEWAQKASTALRRQALVPTPAEMRRVKEEQGHGAPLAIWLGILLDGIPESFVIGAGLIGVLGGHAAAGDLGGLGFWSVVPYTLVLGLFLSNFPEAMSSSIGMRAQGWGRMRVFFMWFVLMVLTGLGAGLGYWLGSDAPHSVVIAIEGIAAGAMLTMIAAAMIPEAIHLGGPAVTGLATLCGFLAAVSFKVLE